MGYRTKEELGRQIATLRTERGLSQRELAELLDVDKSAVSRIEAGERGLALDELGAVADAFGTSVDELLRKDEVSYAFRAEEGDADTNGAVEIFDRVFDDFFALKTAAS